VRCGDLGGGEDVGAGDRSIFGEEVKNMRRGGGVVHFGADFLRFKFIAKPLEKKGWA
jgi:hypothetical protein